ncbi:hypothetical protein O0L34_g13270 [Tuta absoluta]|nr:hypothetical protein O0L34_g13270 [Tuta absoluta]
MDFARKQLEKYGWSDGKGLGKNENGISEPIKAKLKRSVAGIGHDQAAEHTDQWWNKLYDKAAKNVEVEEKNGKTKKIKTKDEKFEITNSSYHLNKSNTKKSNQDEEYSDFFIKKAVLTNEGGGEKKIKESDSEEEVEEKKDVFQMTDEELFAACEGRTAHKGARHGLRALGKLARIEQQEKKLLSDQKYTGYSHTKKHKKHKKNKKSDSEIIESTNLNDASDNMQTRKKKKKRKRCFSNETSLENKNETLQTVLEENDTEMAENGDEETISSAKRKSNDNDDSEIVSKPKKKKHIQNEIMETESTEINEQIVKRNKKKKKMQDV